MTTALRSNPRAKAAGQIARANALAALANERVMSNRKRKRKPARRPSTVVLSPQSSWMEPTTEYLGDGFKVASMIRGHGHMPARPKAATPRNY